MCNCLKFVLLFILFLLKEGVTFSNNEFRTSHRPKQLWNETNLDQLKKDLFMNYDKFARPEEHYNATYIRFGLAVIHLQTDELKSKVTIHSWLRMVWTDNKMKWNESEYDDLSVMRIADHEIWQPDIYLYNSANGAEPIAKYGNPNVLIYGNGEVLWVPTAKLSATCSFDLRHWPFDTQHCSFKFGSWTHDGNEIKIELYNNQKEVDLSDYFTERATWMIANSTAEATAKHYDCCPEPYYEVVFNLTIVRRYQSYKTVIVTPVVVIAGLVLMQFWLPPRSNERLILNCFLVITTILFLLHFSNQIAPAGSNTPLIVMFYSFNLCMISLSIIVNITVFSLSKLISPQSIPWTLRKYLQGNFGKFLFLDWHFEEDSIFTHSKESKNKQHADGGRSSGRCYTFNKSLWTYSEHELTTALVIDRILFVIYGSIYILLGFVYLF